MSTVGVLLLFGCALSFCLPAPEHLSIQSVNLNHTLSWKPGAGTPPGTSYIIYDARRRSRQRITESNETSTRLNLDVRFTYQLTVVASYNNSLSPDSQKLKFTPYSDTKIDPPEVQLSGCGTCLRVKVTPAVRIHFDTPIYNVLIWDQEMKEVLSRTDKTKSTSFPLENLRSNTEYCIQVQVLITLNQNTQPSAWTCAWTSRPEPNTDALIAGLLAGLGMFLVGAVTASAFCLKYMGFICKPQIRPSSVLLEPRRGYTLTPERTIPAQISISPKVEKHKDNSPAAPEPDEEEEEEEEEEGEEGTDHYVVREMELSSDEAPCRDSADGLHGTYLPAGDPENDKDEDDGEESGHSEIQEDVATAEEGSEAEDLEEEQVFNRSGGINLLSVTLGALVRCEEEEQTLEWTEQEALLSHDQTSTSGRTPGEDHSFPDEEEEEEEEEFSGYLTHS